MAPSKLFHPNYTVYDLILEKLIKENFFFGLKTSLGLVHFSREISEEKFIEIVGR